MKSLLKIVCLCFLSLVTLAQSVTILPGGITPAMAGNIPSLTNEQIEALPSPSIGSLANDLTFKCLRYYDGSSWAKVLTNKDSSPVAAAAWVEKGSEMERGYDIKTDANGNVYLTGIFFQNLTIGNQTISNSGGADIFLVKYDKNGNFLWLKKAGASGYDVVEEIEVDESGNIYMTGNFTGTTNFNNLSLTSGGVSDVFLAKYDTNGEIVWVQKAGGVNSDNGKSLFLGNNGEVYLVGDFSNVASFNNTSITSVGSTDVFIAKYDTDGVLEWVKSAGGTSDDSVEGVAVDNTGCVYIIGNFNSTMNFGNTSLTSAGSSDLFIAKYNPINTTWVWAKRGGGTGGDFGRAIIIASGDKILITGTFENTATFEGKTIISEGDDDIYIAEYYPSGNNNWVRREGGKYSDHVMKIGLDSENNIYITGGFYGLTNFGSTWLSNDGSNNAYIAKLNTNGTSQWVQKIGGRASIDVYGMDVEANGNIYHWKV
ncbi:hypothetical protein [Emticicia sp. C21]|uniref:hypothetical protein n=1 Tax=Emticicia sp. C21 TaxID=2302915 RepID=UPI0011C1B4EE|nr:hypothetical protein [Emticicia sp. C21]